MGVTQVAAQVAVEFWLMVVDKFLEQLAIARRDIYRQQFFART